MGKCVYHRDRLKEEDFVKEGIRNRIVKLISIFPQNESNCINESEFEG